MKETTSNTVTHFNYRLVFLASEHDSPNPDSEGDEVDQFKFSDNGILRAEGGWQKTDFSQGVIYKIFHRKDFPRDASPEEIKKIIDSIIKQSF